MERVIAAGMDPERVRASYVVGDPGSVSDQVQAYFDVCLDGIIFNMPAGTPPETVALAGRTLVERFGAGRT